jgi:crotonobetainyl-CoA:carnitine CoA-transferase CaiB-like acyl-CoA transferase
MLDAAIGLLNEKISAYLATGEAPMRMGGGTSITTPHGAFPTADGHIVIGAATDESFRRLAGVLGPPLEGDERLLTQAGRLANRDELERLLVAALSEHGTDHWLATLERAGVPVGRVAGLAAATERHREHSRTGFRAVEGAASFEVLAPAFSSGEEDWGPLPRPGEPGADDDRLLGELGLDPGEIGELREAGVVL